MRLFAVVEILIGQTPLQETSLSQDPKQALPLLQEPLTEALTPVVGHELHRDAEKNETTRICDAKLTALLAHTPGLPAGQAVANMAHAIQPQLWQDHPEFLGSVIVPVWASERPGQPSHHFALKGGDVPATVATHARATAALATATHQMAAETPQLLGELRALIAKEARQIVSQAAARREAVKPAQDAAQTPPEASGAPNEPT